MYIYKWVRSLGRQPLVEFAKREKMAASTANVGEVGTGATSEIVESFYVALDLIPAIVGKKGATIKRIITETKTRIVLPQDNNMKLEIFGNDRQSVALAKQQIMSTVRVMSNRFNIIRITDSGIIKNYERFKDEILRGPPIEGLTEEMFQRPIQLHVTINLMTLVNEFDKARAEGILDDCVEELIGPAQRKYGAITANFTGVEVFRGTQTKASIIGARFKSDSLRVIADGIAERFIEEGLLNRKFKRPIEKMRMTLIKSRHIKTVEDEMTGRKQTIYLKETAIDATTILSKYANYNFGTQKITEIHLCFLLDKDEDGRKKKIHSVKF